MTLPVLSQPSRKALLTRWGLFRHWWVTAKLAITTVLTAALLLLLVPRLGALAGADAVSAGERLPLLIAPIAASVLLVAALLLSVFKPGRRSFRVPAHEA
jgi:hypothetical protein